MHGLISLKRVKDSMPMVGSGFERKAACREAGEDSGVSEACHTLFTSQLKPSEQQAQRMREGNCA